MAHHGEYCWLSAPYGVWRAPGGVQSLDVSSDVVSLRMEADGNNGALTAELRNDDGRYATLPAPLANGAQVEVGPGYRTSVGEEVSAGPAFVIDSIEWTSAPGKASLLLSGRDGWGLLAAWTARSQLRWNKSSSEKNILDILAWLLGRVGLKLEVRSASSTVTGFYPDFAAHPGDRGDALVTRLLSLVPDVLLIEGGTAYLINPQASDAAEYSYGTAHSILEGSFREASWPTNRVLVEGYDPMGGGPIIVDSLVWDEAVRLGDRLETVRDRNLVTVAAAQQRGEAVLRKADIGSGAGAIVVPVNCGQQVYDVVEITDVRTGLWAAKRRVLGMTSFFQPGRGRYQQRLALGGV
jgi:hypothetical protein